MSKLLDLKTATLEELLIDLGSRCHEGVSLSGGLGFDDWVCHVCSTSSNGFNTPIEAVQDLYQKYVLDLKGLRFC